MAVTPPTPTPPTLASSTSSTRTIQGTRTVPATRLGCGRDVDQVWDTVDQPANEHERRCSYCTKARAELAVLSQATQDLTAADQRAENLTVPDQMLSNVLAIVRIEVRRGRTIPLQHRIPPTSSTAPGAAAADAGPGYEPAAVPANLTVSELVIATVVRQTCDRNPDVEVRRVSIDTAPARTTATPPRPQTAGDETGAQPGAVVPAEVSMNLQATVSRTAAIPALVTGLRAAIQAAVTAQIGVTVTRINVEVQDLIDA